MTMLCSQCATPAERCDRCAGALCARRLCTELHEASCVAVSQLPAEPFGIPTAVIYKPRPRIRRARDLAAERQAAQDLVRLITAHRQTGRAALLVGDLDAAFDELWVATLLEPDLDRLGAVASEYLPHDWELETDLTPLARALSNRRHPRAADAWRRLLDRRPARSIQAEAANWLARDAAAAGDQRAALRLTHVASRLGRSLTPTLARTDTESPAGYHAAYRRAGIEPVAAFGLYLAASRIDASTARVVGLTDPLTLAAWSDQPARWWAADADEPAGEHDDHQVDALHRARDLALTRRDHGWLLLAEGDHLAGPLGVRTLGRSVRAGCAEPAEEDTFVRIRLAYEGAAERLPDVAWPWYRLAELLAWAGFADRAEAHLAEAERRGLGHRDAERTQRAVLGALVQAGLGRGPTGLPTPARPFPAEPFAPRTGWRLRFW